MRLRTHAGALHSLASPRQAGCAAFPGPADGATFSTPVLPCCPCSCDFPRSIERNRSKEYMADPASVSRIPTALAAVTGFRKITTDRAVWSALLAHAAMCVVSGEPCLRSTCGSEQVFVQCVRACRLLCALSRAAGESAVHTRLIVGLPGGSRLDESKIGKVDQEAKHPCRGHERPERGRPKVR